MLLRPTLPLSLLLLIASSPVSAVAESTSVKTSLIPRAVHNLHSTAVKHTKSFARDLRVVFGALLVASPDDQTSQHVIYCKPQRKSGGSVPTTGATSNGNGTSSASAGSSTRGGSTSKPTGTGSTSKGPSATGVPASPWKLTQSSQGDTFFDDWTWFTAPDPTNGIVQYVDQKTAYGNNLASINNAGNAIMRVETTPKVSGNRMSVRITTNYQFNGGLIVMDAVHMPTGCGVWPAWWTNGPNWPTGGEIDIVEGVGDYTNNQATIHTDPGCTLSSADANTLKISGSVIGGTDCAALTTGNQGCGIRAGSSNSFGAAFNKNGGGTYAMKWDGSGIAVYFFPRGSEPADLEANAPNPDRWGNPQARWPASGCDPFKYFNNHHGIFDTTLCGDWAGGVWNSAGIPGQEQSCAQRTGFSTCEDFVRNNGGSMQEAYWEVRSVKLFQTD